LQGGSGYARQITFEQIILVNVMNPIIIDQYYNITPKVHISPYIIIIHFYHINILFYYCLILYIIVKYVFFFFLNCQDTSVLVSDVTYRGFTGTSTSDVAIDLKCSPSGCFGLQFDQNNIVSTQPGKKTSSFCINAHGSAINTIPSVSCLSK
jgi:hypothetical protein